MQSPLRFSMAQSCLRAHVGDESSKAWAFENAAVLAKGGAAANTSCHGARGQVIHIHSLTMVQLYPTVQFLVSLHLVAYQGVSPRIASRCLCAPCRISTPHATSNLAAALPTSRCVVLQAVGHLSHEERPESLISCVSAFCIEVLKSAERADT